MKLYFYIDMSFLIHFFHEHNFAFSKTLLPRQMGWSLWDLKNSIYFSRESINKVYTLRFFELTQVLMLFVSSNQGPLSLSSSIVIKVSQ